MHPVLDGVAAGVVAISIIFVFVCGYKAHRANLARLIRDRDMSKRAIICFCGKAKPCERSDCQHSTAVAKRNELICKNNSIYRVKKAREALAALQDDEFNDVMVHFCRFCGGAPDCFCTRDD